MRKQRKLTDLQIAAFCEQIEMVIKAGLPIHQGVYILLNEARDKETKDFLTNIYQSLERGSSLHKALEQTEAFPVYMLRMVSLGEETGKLEEIIASLAVYYRKEDEIRKTVRYAVQYPFFMFFMVLAVMGVLILKVLPVFADIYESLGTEITGTAHVMMSVSIWLSRYLMVILCVLLVLVVILYMYYKSKNGRKLLQKNAAARGIALSRLTNCMYLAVASGLNIEYGLKMGEELIENETLQQKIRDCTEKINHGYGVANSLTESGIFSRMYASWLDIAYLTGNIDEVLKKICMEYEEQADQKISRAISRIEPALVIFLSVVVGLILTSFLLPLMGIMSGIGV